MAGTASEATTAANRRRNLLNFVIMIAVALPALGFARWFQGGDCDPEHSSLCRIALQHPFCLVNLVFAVNVCLLFWLISLFQGSTWLIDPYWTFIPLFILHWFLLHPHTVASGFTDRRQLVTLLVWVWSARLTHSYFRRERWQFGAREDWRFAEMRRRCPNQFWWFSLFFTYVSQQPMLVLLCLPLWPLVSLPETAMEAANQGLSAWLWPALALFAILWAGVADTQLYRFTQENVRRAQAGKPRVLILRTGLWRFSRHPNYFGEQLWWWALAGWAYSLGAEPWYFAGAVFNSLCMLAVTAMVEERMARPVERRKAWAEYKRQVSMWVPLFVCWRDDGGPAKERRD